MPSWPWLALAGLGAFHGLNPAMGWLFAVALGLQNQSRGALLRALVPIAIGHALSIALVVVAVAALQSLVNLTWLQIGAAVVLIAFGVYRLSARHRVRAGMQVTSRDLVVWSFFMATAHGAGLMLLPVLLEMPLTPAVHAHHDHALMTAVAALGQSGPTTAAIVVVHTLAMLTVAGAVSIAVYEWLGLALLRRGWINLDLLWTLALLGAGVVLLIAALR
jgi:hypothetical protein